MKYTKIELSLAVGLLAAIVWCALEPRFTLQWWCAAFEPLCDGVLTTSGGEGIVCRSFFAELITRLLA